MTSSTHGQETRKHADELGDDGRETQAGQGSEHDGRDMYAAIGEPAHGEAEMTDIRTIDPHDDPMYAQLMTNPTQPTAKQMQPARALESGTLIGAYRISRLIGRGGCSTVYLARHSTTGELVAIKVLHPRLALSSRQVQRFIQEAQALQRIRHPNIVAIHESGHVTEGCPYLVMELIDGHSLAEVLLQRGRLSPQEALDLLEPICETLAHVHQAGIVHRDIKASNIMLLDEPGRPRIKLLDFGIAKLMHGEPDDALKTSIGRVLGTPHSMAPEQILGREVDGRTDVYALGALLFRLLTGRHPYSSRDAQHLVQMHLDAPLPRPSAHAPVTPALDEVVQRAMAKEPEHRFASPRALLGELRRALRPKTVAAEVGVQALAVLVQGSVAEPGGDADSGAGSHDDGDDELAQIDLMEALDCAIEFLRQHGFEIVMQTSDSVLGVMPVVESLAEMRLVVLHATKLLHKELSRRPSAHPRVHINLCVHRGSANLRGRHVDHELNRIRGGALLDIGDWAPRSRLHGVYATREVMPGRRREGGSRYVRVDSDGI